MNLHSLLHARAEEGRPVRVGLIGAGKFGTMFLSQALHTPGLHVLGVADINVKRAQDNLAATHWPRHLYQAASGAEVTVVATAVEKEAPMVAATATEDKVVATAAAQVAATAVATAADVLAVAATAAGVAVEARVEVMVAG